MWSVNLNLSATDLSSGALAVERRQQLLLILAVFILVLVADQVTKAIVVATIEENSISFAGREEEFFFFTHQRNPGLMGGMFSHMPAVALVAPVLATLVLVYLYRHIEPASKVQSLSYGMIAGGAVGNLIDRFLREGGVVDFLQFNFYFIPFDFPWKRYPAFNIADSAICVGVFLLLIGWRSMEKRAHVSNPA